MTASITGIPTSKSRLSDEVAPVPAPAPAAAGSADGVREAVLRRESLTARDRDEMFALFGRYFEAPDRAAFERDLDEKEWVVVLRDESGIIDGFSTLVRIDLGAATVFFSGDTIVARHRWGSPDLARLWSRHVFALADAIGGDVYWFLITSGYRTYRFLPLFFREFLPAHRSEPMQAILEEAATRKFGERYDPATGVIRMATPTPLREGVSDPDERAQRDPHVRFFLHANPGHAAGDELACLTRVAVDNLTSAGLRMIGRR